MVVLQKMHKAVILEDGYPDVGECVYLDQCGTRKNTRGG
jgi:hypothetical protein